MGSSSVNTNVPPDDQGSPPPPGWQMPRAEGLVEGNLSQEPRQPPYKLSMCSRKRKRNESDENVENSSPQSPEQTPTKQQRTFPSSTINWKASSQASPSGVGRNSDHRLQHWVQTGGWRKEDFKQTSQVIDDVENSKAGPESSQQDGVRDEEGSSAESNSLIKQHGMQARPQSRTQMREQSVIEISALQSTRESNNTRYYNDKYEVQLMAKGSHMHPPPSGIAKASESLFRKLLEETPKLPQDTLFRDDLFKWTCESVQEGGREMIVRDISPLICPSIQALRVYKTYHHAFLNESVNETWHSIVQYEGPLPQPAYSVGFRHNAFNGGQLGVLEPFVERASSERPTYFMATPSVFFPFLTCEVEYGEGALDIADRRNIQSLSMALKALVILFRLAKREKELEGRLLGFSISHDHESVRIYGYCPVGITGGAQTRFYRLPIHNVRFADGKDKKWVAYQFVRNVYDHFAPMLHSFICGAVNDLPPAPSASDSDNEPSLPDSDTASSDESSEVLLASAAQDRLTPATSVVQVDTPPYT